MITKPQLQRLIITRLNFMHITEERLLPEFGGSAVRQPNNTLEWVLPTERFSFGGNGKTWEEARSELIDGIWNRLNGQPVTNRKMRICQFCGRSFVSPNRNSKRFCNKGCSDGYWHGISVERRREKVEASL